MSFVRACAVSDVPGGGVIATTVDGVDLAIVNSDDGWFAIQDECSHAAIPLSEGDVDGCHLECYLHGSRFDLRTGYPDQLPATVPVPVYPTRVEGDDVLVDTENPIDVEELEQN